jgi:outer membrane protein assembly factor BamD (BamD/ComL family)
MTRVFRGALLSVAAFLCLGEGSVRAQAKAEDKAVAEALFREARQLLDAKQYAAACRKLEESYRLDPAGGTLMNMAMCHGKEGRGASSGAE